MKKKKHVYQEMKECSANPDYSRGDLIEDCFDHYIQIPTGLGLGGAMVGLIGGGIYESVKIGISALQGFPEQSSQCGGAWLMYGSAIGLFSGIFVGTGVGIYKAIRDYMGYRRIKESELDKKIYGEIPEIKI